MPLLKRLIKVGDGSRAVIIPYEWLKFHELRLGRPITDVLVEVNGAITIRIADATDGSVDSRS